MNTPQFSFLIYQRHGSMLELVAGFQLWIYARAFAEEYAQYWGNSAIAIRPMDQYAKEKLEHETQPWEILE